MIYMIRKSWIMDVVLELFLIYLVFSQRMFLDVTFQKPNLITQKLKIKMEISLKMTFLTHL